MSYLLSGLLLVLTATWVPSDTLQKGFTLYWGTGAGTYESSADVGNVTKFVHDYDFSGFPKVCFVVKAYNSMGFSDPSNEVCLAVPKKPVVLVVK